MHNLLDRIELNLKNAISNFQDYKEESLEVQKGNL